MAPRRPRRSSGRWRARAGDAGPSEPPLPPDVATHAAQLEAERLPLLRRQLRALGLIASRRSRAALARRLARALHAQRALARIPAASHDRFDRARAGHAARAGGCCRLCGSVVSPPRRTFCCDECVHFHRLRTSGTHVRKALAIRDEGICSLCGINALAAYRKAVLEVRTALAKPAPARVIGTVVTGGSSSETGSASAALDKAHTSRATAALALEVAVRGGHFEKHATLSSEKGRIARVKQGSFWQADHIVPVSAGGGSCGLSNFRTLCTPCHAAVTARQATARAQQRHARSADEGRSPSLPETAPHLLMVIDLTAGSETSSENEEPGDDELSIC